MTSRVARPDDGRVRCAWGARPEPDYRAYHDLEWGVPIRDERHLFELLVLEGAQAGLSWWTILRKRDGYRRAFAGFDPAAVAAFGDGGRRAAAGRPGDRAQPGQDRVGDRQRAGDARAPGGGLEPRRPPVVVRGRAAGRQRLDGRTATIPAETDASRAMSKDLKARGFRFVGPTICYALMQSAGLVNDHVVTCFRYAEVQAAG